MAGRTGRRRAGTAESTSGTGLVLLFKDVLMCIFVFTFAPEFFAWCEMIVCPCLCCSDHGGESGGIEAVEILADSTRDNIQRSIRVDCTVQNFN
jgi:hypothetical protein